MDSGKWKWTAFGWERLGYPKLAESRISGVENETYGTHQLQRYNKEIERNRYYPTVNFYGSLDSLNAEVKGKPENPFDLKYEERKWSLCNVEKTDKFWCNSNPGMGDFNPDDLTEICLSTSVIPSILLHDRLSEDLKRRFSMSCELFVTPRNTKSDASFDCRDEICDYSRKNISHGDVEKKFAQRMKQIECHLPVTKDENEDDFNRYNFTNNVYQNEMSFLDKNDLCDENLVDDMLKELDDVDDVEESDGLNIDEESVDNDMSRETEAERMKRQLSLMGKDSVKFHHIRRCLS